jgi:hypothetical protein
MPGKIEIHKIPGPAGKGAPDKPLMMVDADEFGSLGDEDVLSLRDQIRSTVDKVSQESEDGMDGFVSTSQKNMYKYLLSEEHRSFDMADDEPYRAGSMVRARRGTDLYRYLSDYHKNPNISLKVEEVSVFNEDAHDYLVSMVSSNTSWLASQPLPVAHVDIEPIGSVLTGVPGSVSREGTGGPLQEDA